MCSKLETCPLLSSRPVFGFLTLVGSALRCFKSLGPSVESLLRDTLLTLQDTGPVINWILDPCGHRTQCPVNRIVCCDMYTYFTLTWCPCLPERPISRVVLNLPHSVGQGNGTHRSKLFGCSCARALVFRFGSKRTRPICHD